MELPELAADLVGESDSRILDHLRRRGGRGRGFVACDAVAVYSALQQLAEASLLRGPRFCEWGSGFGVVTALASTLGYESSGIEIQADLVDAANELARDFAIEADFAHGTFVPPSSAHLILESDEQWWRADGPVGYEALEADPAEFDLFFAYPWPGECATFEKIFAHCGASGALLLTYDDVAGIQLRRKDRTGRIVQIESWD